MRLQITAYILALLIGTTFFTSPSRAADVELLNFNSRFDLHSVKTNGGAKISAVENGPKVALHVETAHESQWPGIELPCPAGHWDLSKQAYVDVDLRNPTDRPVRVDVRVDNPGADGVFNCCGDGMVLAPKQTGTVRVELHRRKPDWIKVELFGMRGYPWGTPLGWGKPGQNTIDAANVTNLVIFVPTPKDDHVYEVLAIRAGGSFFPTTDLLKDPERFFPFIDEFGQYMHRDWPGKTHNPADMQKARDQEAKDLAAHPAPSTWDRYGGWKGGPALKAIGFFYAAKHADKWWLVDPDGNLFFSVGLDCVTPWEGGTAIDDREKWFKDRPARDAQFKKCYGRIDSVVRGYYQGKQPATFDFGQANLIRKYGPDWLGEYAEVSHLRLRSWGINTIANWSAPEIYLRKKTPYTVGIWHGGKFLQGSSGYWGKFRDVFDPSFTTEVRGALAKEKQSSADPWCIGYFVDNELSWGEDGISLAAAALASPPDQPAKKVFLDDLRKKYDTIDKLNHAWGTQYDSWDALLKQTTPPDAAKAHDDLAAFYGKFAETYFKTIRDAVKEVAPNHLYLGCRLAWSNPAVVAASAKYCDVVSFNIYKRSVDDGPIDIPQDVPILIGEFHFGALDRGMFHTGLVPVAGQAERAAAYKQFVLSALHHPKVVGCHWFKYVDEPTTGRAYDEENYQIGFVDIADTPYPETIQAAREIGAKMYAGN